MLSGLLWAASLTGCKSDKGEPHPTGPAGVDIEFENVVGNSALQLNSTAPYSTPAGDQFTVTTLRYYISNIKLKRADGSEYVQPESYYLIDQERPASQKFTIPNVPAGDYTGLTFTIGVDAARNVAGAQTGALAPSDMFWDWSSGYIFTKLEGRSPQAPGGAISFQIIGFSGPYNAVRTVSPALPTTGTAIIAVGEDHTPKVHIKADVLKMFSGPTTVRFATTNNVLDGADAVRIADNQAAGMFTIGHIHGE
jgi:hypothetical protein